MRIFSLLACALLAACFSKPANNTGGGGGDDAGVDDAPIDGPPIGPGATAMIAGGQHHACRLKDGTVLCWGNNDHGQLGGNRTDVPDYSGNPGQAWTSQGWTSVATGQQHTCGVRDGKLYCWGENFSQQSIPGNTNNDIGVLTEVVFAGSPTIDRVFAGAFMTCATTSTHEAYCWGQINFQGTTPFPQTPQRLGGTATFTDIAIGGDHACAIAEGGRVHCWGLNQQRQVGQGSSTATVSFANAAPVDSTELFTSIAADQEATCATTVAGKLVCWGSANQGQLSTATGGAGHTAYVVDETKVWTAVTVGPRFSCGVADGDVYCWGDDAEGALGDGTFHGRRALPSVPIALGMKASQLTGGDGFACALSSDGVSMKCWGTNGKGQLGNKKYTRKYVPTEAQLPAGSQVAKLIAGDYHTCALVGAGPGYTAYCWGRNDDHQVGSASLLSVQPIPVAVDTLRSFVDIVAGEKHTCAISADRMKMECWGSNEASQLAAGSNGAVRNAIDMQDTGWTAIGAGSRMSCGIDNGELYCWGDLVGNLPSTPTVTIQPKYGNRPWRSIAVGSDFAIAVAMNGSAPTIMGIGSAMKQCAAGLASDATPVPDVPDTWLEIFSGFTQAFGTNVPMLSAAQAGGAHACMHRVDSGTTRVTCWGNPSISAVGGTTGPPAVPQCLKRDENTVNVGTGWRSINAANPGMFAMADQTCALDVGGVLKCWGTNSNFELGKIGGNASPTQVFPRQWRAIAGGDDHTCGIAMDDGKVYCWGENQYGQIGDNTSYEPLPVISGVP